MTSLTQMKFVDPKAEFMFSFCYIYLYKIKTNTTMDNVILNNWTPFVPGSIIPNDVNFINLDTRDFNWVLNTSDISELHEAPEALSYFMKQSDEFKRQHVISAETLAFWVQYLYEKSGGTGEWRHLCYKKSGGWLKYIWFIRVNENEFAVYDRERSFIVPTTIKDVLDFDNAKCSLES